ncbi:MAG: hypothetical protein KBA98_08990, partial [Syntrophorhabdaceae bacterium]|nr:hypothetical protein [Syntrophorhabdaceae bacterium]
IGSIAEDEKDLHVMLNMSGDSIKMPLPQSYGHVWYRVIDTSLPYPDDIARHGDEKKIKSPFYFVAPRSIVVSEGHIY